MFRIHYLLDWSDSPHSGVAVKVSTQIKYWAKAGVKTKLVLITPKKYANEWRKTQDDIEVYCYKNSLGRYLARLRAFHNIHDLDKNIVCYLRFGIFLPIQRYFLLKSKYILEINTLDLSELEHRNILVRTINRWTRSKVIESAIGLCAVTYEIKDSFLKEFPHAKIAVFPNAAEMNQVTIVDTPLNIRKKFVFVGTAGQTWHGIDRLIEIARVMPEFDFLIVGPEASSNPHPKNVSWLGKVYESQLDQILDQCDFAISSLALDRNGMTEASPLKTRKYLSHGLPVVAGYKDTGIVKGENYFLRLDFESMNYEEIRIRILTFTSFWENKRVPIQLLSSISYDEIESKRITFIRSIKGK